MGRHRPQGGRRPRARQRPSAQGGSVSGAGPSARGRQGGTGGDPGGTRQVAVETQPQNGIPPAGTDHDGPSAARAAHHLVRLPARTLPAAPGPAPGGAQAPAQPRGEGRLGPGDGRGDVSAAHLAVRGVPGCGGVSDPRARRTEQDAADVGAQRAAAVDHRPARVRTPRHRRGGRGQRGGTGSARLPVERAHLRPAGVRPDRPGLCRTGPVRGPQVHRTARRGLSHEGALLVCDLAASTRGERSADR